MNAISALSRTRARGRQAARTIGSAAILALALLAHGCIDSGEPPLEAAEITLAQVVRPGPGPGGGGGAGTPDGSGLWLNVGLELTEAPPEVVQAAQEACMAAGAADGVSRLDEKGML